MRRICLIIGCLLFLISFSQAQDPAQTEISLLTVGPGDDVSSLFGHTAIRIYHPDSRSDLVYNYGIFDPSDELQFITDFVRGNTQYKVDAYAYSRFLREYDYYGRWVKEQRLNLNPEQKKIIEEFLQDNIKPENQKYLYNFFYDNCSSRVKDVFEALLPGYEFVDSPIKQTTYRQLLDEYLVNRDWTDFGIDIIIAAPGDEVIDHQGQMFLPDYLMLYMDKFTSAEGVPIVASTQSVLPSKRTLPTSFWITPLKFFGALLVLEIFFFLYRNKWQSKWISRYDNFWFLALTLASSLLLFMLTTKHTACYPNWNLLWISPLFIPFWIIRFSNKDQWKLWLGYAIIGILIITVAGWTFWPQTFPAAGLIITVLLILKMIRIVNTDRKKVAAIDNKGT